MACATCGTAEACGCTSNYKEKDFGQRVTWTLGGTSPGAATILLVDETIQGVAPTISQLQATITVSEASANFKCKVGFQVSADGTTWDNTVWLGAGPDYQVGNGSLVTAWHTTTTNYKKNIRFVVQAEQNGTANVIEVAHVRIVIGFQVK
jgi:hypothetical protein